MNYCWAVNEAERDDLGSVTPEQSEVNGVIIRLLERTIDQRIVHE